MRCGTDWRCDRFCREPGSPDQESMTFAPGVVRSQSFRFSRIAYVRKHSLLFLYLLVVTTSCHLKNVQQLPMVLFPFLT